MQATVHRLWKNAQGTSSRMLSVPVLAGAEHYGLRQVFWLVMSRAFSQPKAAMAFVPAGTAGNHPLGRNARHTRHFAKDTQQRDCAGFPPASLLIAHGTKARVRTAVTAKLRILVRKNATPTGKSPQIMRRETLPYHESFLQYTFVSFILKPTDL